ncbi:trypsin-like peptidase domain-containing protein [Streptomyces sp. RK9]|uniref:trypsin-like peptidase domain-containing protein n=1 Tax=Streptomyces sp. RK9 TaxID=3239284 RepID=UPI00386B6B5E
MEQDRVIRVIAHGPADGPPGSARSGTGHLIAPRLVLTAAHLVPPGTAPAVVTAPGAEPYRAAVRWRRDTDTLDAALVEIRDTAWQPPESFGERVGRRPQRWGRLVTHHVGQSVCCHGFPRVQRAAEGAGPGAGPMEQISARINPLTGFPVRRYELVGPVGVFGAGRDLDSPWAGLSGAAVFTAEPGGVPGEERPGDLLLGVVRADRQADSGVRLTATRAEDLLADHVFRAVVEEHCGVPPELEAAELAGLLAPVRALRELRSPLTVLRADVEAVSFRGREKEVRELRAWCVESGAAQQVGTLVGPGGQGKTRLARELAGRLRAEGWVAGRLRHEALPGDPARLERRLRPLVDVRYPTLVVVDYAETRPDVVRALAALAEDARDRFRVLLLARSLGTWMTSALGRLDPGRGTADRASGVPDFSLGPLYRDPAPAADAFRLAVADLARLLPLVPGYEGVDWPLTASGIQPPPARSDSRESPLSLHMRALESLLRRGLPDAGAERRQGLLLEQALLQHESDYWARAAVSHGLSTDPTAPGADTEALLRRAVAATTLCGAADRAEARATLARLPREPYEPPVPVARLDEWLRGLYPAARDRHWGTLHPDRVAEHQAAQEVTDDPELLPALLTDASDAQWTSAFTVLTRAVVAHTNEDRPERAHAVLAVLDRTLADLPASTAALRACLDALPRESQVLCRFAARLARRLVDSHRDAPWPDGPTDAERARDQHHLAARLGAVQQWDEAVHVARTALGTRRQLAEADPRTHEADLAASYDLYAQCLRAVEEVEEALRHVRRALAIQRRLDRQRPERYRSGLIEYLNTAAVIEWDHDRRDKSNRLSAEAAGLSRWLQSTQPGDHLNLLIDSLNSQSIGYWNDGRYQEATRVTDESLRILDEQVAVNRDAYAPYLATALMSQALNYDPQGGRQESLDLAHRAVAVRRRLAADLPEAHEAALGEDLRNLALTEFFAEHREPALRLLREAVDVWGAVHRRTGRARHGRDLAMGLWALSDVLSRADDDLGEAITALEKSVDIRRRVAASYGQNPNAPVADRLMDLGHYRRRRALLEGADFDQELAEAVRIFQECVFLRRDLAAEDPAADRQGDLCDALINLLGCYEAAGRTTAYRVLLREVLPLLRGLAARDQEWRPAQVRNEADLGMEYELSGRESLALPLLTKALADAPPLEQMGVTPYRLRQWLHSLLRAQSKHRRYAAAVRTAERIVAEVHREREQDPDCAAPLGSDTVALALAYARAGRHGEALRLVADGAALVRREAAGESVAWQTYALCEEAETYLVCARATRSPVTARAALAPARAAVRLTRRERPPGHTALRTAVDTLAAVYVQLGRAGDADHVRRSLAPPPEPRSRAHRAAHGTTTARTATEAT